MVHLHDIHLPRPLSPRLASSRPASPKPPIITQAAPIHLHAPTLRNWILAKQSLTPSERKDIPQHVQVVDVRDDDYEGGHIKGSMNVPSHGFPDRVDKLVDELHDNEAVVFHCALSQLRGPSVLYPFEPQRLLSLSSGEWYLTCGCLGCQKVSGDVKEEGTS
jgi:Rhodanese-like domain